MRRYARGMNLIEVSIVLAIVGGMTAMGISTLGSLRESGESRGEAQKLLVSLRDARTLSIVTGVRHGIYYGGNQDTAYNAAGRTFDLRNTVATFRKPSVQANASIFQPGADIILSQRYLPHAPGTPQNGLMVLSLMNSGNASSFVVLFDQEGQPYISLAGTPVQFPASGPLVFSMRKVTPSTKLTTRTNTQDIAPAEFCLALERTGDAKLVPRKLCSLTAPVQ